MLLQALIRMLKCTHVSARCSDFLLDQSTKRTIFPCQTSGEKSQCDWTNKALKVESDEIKKETLQKRLQSQLLQNAMGVTYFLL